MVDKLAALISNTESTPTVRHKTLGARGAPRYLLDPRCQPNPYDFGANGSLPTTPNMPIKTALLLTREVIVFIVFEPPASVQ